MPKGNHPKPPKGKPLAHVLVTVYDKDDGTSFEVTEACRCTRHSDRHVEHARFGKRD